MATLINIPDFRFSGFYYPELLEDLIQYFRVNVPEITDENPQEPMIQLIRMTALVGHLCNTYLDLVAKENFLPTLRLRSSLRALLALIDYQLKQASPATADLVLELSQVFTATKVTVPITTRFGVPQSEGQEVIDYEALKEYSTPRTDQVTSVMSYNDGSGNFTDHTAEAITPTGNFAPDWYSGPGDALYVGHSEILWGVLRIVFAVAASGITAGVWEYYDGNKEQAQPDAVVNNGSNLTLTLTTLLGASNRSNTTITVKCTLTGVSETINSSFPGSVNKATTVGLLGQSSPSTNPSDYIVGTDWQELPDIIDGTSLFAAGVGNRDVKYTFPQSVIRNWRKTTVNAIEAYWIRFRIIDVSGPTLPSITQVRIDTGKQYQLISVTQGLTREDDPVGSSTGLPDQSFQLARYPVIDDSTMDIFVDEGSGDVEWTRVVDFLSSVSTDKHYTLEFDDDGRGVITFGDGTNGKIPSAGVDNIRAAYRTMDDVDGNVGPNAITQNKGGLAFVNKLYNPRQANGYQTREGSTDEDIARLKQAGPATLRTRERAVTGDDAVDLAVAFIASDGSRPVIRAFAIEEAYGPKTIGIVCVGVGGAALTTDQLTELQIYFNGDIATNVKGVLVMNNDATCENYIQHGIDVDVDVYGGNLAAVTTALTALLSPIAVDDDGITYKWDFGGEIPLSEIYSAVQNTKPRPRRVDVNTPGGNTTLNPKELPVVGVLTINMNP